MRLILSCLLICHGKVSSVDEVSNRLTIDREEKQTKLEDRLINEYGSLLIRQQTENKSIAYIFYKVQNNKELFTLIQIDSHSMNTISIKRLSTINFKGTNNKRYSPKYKYTTPIHSTNNRYLMRKFYTLIWLSDEVMDNLSAYYLTSEESSFLKKLDLFKRIQDILKKK